MDAIEAQPRKLVLRLGAKVNLESLPSLPSHFRARVSHLSGTLGVVFMCPSTGEAWCRLNSGYAGQIYPPSIKHIEARTFPLNYRQIVTPTPDAIDLHPHMFVECRDGYVGKLAGVVSDAGTGIVTSLLTRVRTGLAAAIAGPSDPLAPLMEVAGQEVMISPAWAKTPETVNHLLGAGHHLRIDATASQVAHSLVLRDDGQLLQDVYAILGKSHAVANYLNDFQVSVHDGEVTISGVALSPRLRAAVESDIWHVPGVLFIRNNLNN